jgi:hypothetical protein
MNKIIQQFKIVKRLYQKIDDIQKAVARIEKRQLNQNNSVFITAHEFKAFSQWGEDGIIQFLIDRIEIPNKIFVEFGVENYTEANTRFLLQNNNWSGLVIDGSEENISYIKNDPIYWRYNLKAECAFIDCDNINQLISANGISGDIGLLSIDIDGNDYWVWEVIDCVQPRIVICEYNSIFGPQAQVTIPYDRNFTREKAHHSCLFYGASIAALTKLAKKKEYSLVGSNSAGNNVFFVRNDLVADIKIYQAEEAYVKAQFRESKDIKGNLTFLDFEQRLELIRDLEVFDLKTGNNIQIREIKI